MFFNLPDWSLNGPVEGIDFKISILHSVGNMLKEDALRLKIGSRTKSEKISLLVRRIITYSLNAVLIGASWYAIYIVNVD